MINLNSIFVQIQYSHFLGEHNASPLTWYNVKKDKEYRFRVIGVGSMYPIRISVDQHDITVIASDGYDLKPMVVESFIINPGERFDFLLTTNQSVDNYWIRGESIEVSSNCKDRGGSRGGCNINDGELKVIIL